MRHLGTRSLALLYIRIERGTSAASEDQDEDVTMEIVSKCGAEICRKIYILRIGKVLPFENPISGPINSD